MSMIRTSVRIREDFRRDGLFLNFLAGPDLMHLLALSFPGSIINVGYPYICKSEYAMCSKIVDSLSKTDVDVALVGHARKEHLKSISSIVNCTPNTSANFWIPVSDLFISRTIGSDENRLIEHVTDLLKYWKSELSDRPVDVALVDCTSKDRNYESRIAKLSSCITKHGGKSIIVCDTRGIATPQQTVKIFEVVRDNGKVIMEFHPHNDSGQAVDNIEAAITSGASVIGTSVYGLGERGTMIDPRMVAVKYGIPHNPLEFSTFEEEYKKTGFDQDSARQLVNSSVITGSQYRLFGRDTRKRVVFGVTSDKYILSRLSGLEEKSIKDSDLAGLKDYMYTSGSRFLTEFDVNKRIGAKNEG